MDSGVSGKPAAGREALGRCRRRDPAPEGGFASRVRGAGHSKEGHRVLCQAVRVRYSFVREQQAQHSVRRLCQMMGVHPSGYYAWLACPSSKRGRENEVLLCDIKHAWLESGGVYGYRKIQSDLHALGIACGKHRVHRLMRREGLRSQTGYRRRPSPQGGRPSVVAPSLLQQQFNVDEPNRARVTDIRYIRTHEGWLYLAVVIGFFCDWQSFLKAHGLVASMSRRGNCSDSAVAESFFQLLKRERIRRKIYPDRAAARQDVFEYIKMFCNPVRRHGHAGKLLPIEFERRHTTRLESVLESRGDSGCIA